MLFLGIFGCCDRHTRLYRSTQYEQRTGRISPLPAAVRAGTKVISTHLNDSLRASGTTGTLRDKVLIAFVSHHVMWLTTFLLQHYTGRNCWFIQVASATWQARIKVVGERAESFESRSASLNLTPPLEAKVFTVFIVFARWTEHVSSERYLPQITILCPQLEKRSYHNGNKLCSVQLFFVQKHVHSRLQSKFLQEKWKFCWVLNPELLYNVVHENSKGLPNLFFCWFKQRQVTFSCWYTVRFSAPHQLILS